ncbi:MAG: RIP metalloprotease RseP [Bacillota bacterium]|nr:RIP metalloprotease RseP [Bacillota bacterium]
MLKTVIIVIIMFEVLIIGHELGHFITAKKVGIKINEFSIGMGPAVFRKQKGETLYALRLFPIGGYVAMEGEDDDSDDERSFNRKTIPEKILVVSSGAVMNYLMAVLVLVVMIMMIGTPTNSLRDIDEGSPAELAGLLPGDTIISIDGIETDNWNDITGQIRSKSEGDIISVEIKRDKAENTFVKDIPVMKNDSGNMYIGIFSRYEKNIFVAIKQGFINSFELIKLIFKSLEMIITGEASVKEVVGPVGIVSVMGDSSSYGAAYVLYLTALIGVNLAIVNLLPLPALDGGRLLFLIISGITGKPVNPELEGRIHYLGFMALLVLMVMVTVKDINQFIL